jgi:hypothetical protein
VTPILLNTFALLLLGFIMVRSVISILIDWPARRVAWDYGALVLITAAAVAMVLA